MLLPVRAMQLLLVAIVFPWTIGAIPFAEIPHPFPAMVLPIGVSSLPLAETALPCPANVIPATAGLFRPPATLFRSPADLFRSPASLFRPPAGLFRFRKPSATKGCRMFLAGSPMAVNDDGSTGRGLAIAKTRWPVFIINMFWIAKGISLSIAAREIK